MGTSSRKRKHSLNDIDFKETKKHHLENIYNNQDEISESCTEIENINQTNFKINVPNKLIEFMYKLQLSELCLYRKLLHERDYTSLSVTFQDFEIEKFHDIVICNSNRSAHIHIEYIDNQYRENYINYSKLFAKKERCFSINNYFDSYVKHIICKSNLLHKKVKYLIIYTNSSLDIDDDMKLKQGRFRVFYPFKFDKLDIEKCYVLKDFLYTSDDVAKHNFYKFSQEEDTKIEFLNRLEFSPAMQKEFQLRQISEEFQNKLKKKFLNKLVFAVEQLNREQLQQTIKNETKDLKSYVQLKEEVLNSFLISKKDISSIIYDFYILLFTLHDMFLHNKISFTTFKSNNLFYVISVFYKNKISFLAPYNAKRNITYTQLFPSKALHDKNMFCINKYFSFFVEELANGFNNTKFFIIYTNVGLDISEKNELKKGKTKDFYPLKFDSIDIQKNRYKFLKSCTFINTTGLYQFAKEDATMLKTLLKVPTSIKRDQARQFDETENEIKEKFLHKLIFATNQSDAQQLYSYIRSKIKESDLSYTYEELHEVALRWLESYDFGCITVKIMRELLDDVKNNRTSHQFQRENILEEIKFTKSVVGTEGTPLFNQFLHFITKREGKKYIENLSKNGVDLVNLSCILNKTGSYGIQAFKNFYNLWFDKNGNATMYLRILEQSRINLASISSILRGSRHNSANAFEDFFYMLFDKNGKKTHYLKTLEKENISMINIASILSGAGAYSAKTFKEIYDLWFDEHGNKTQYLKSLEENKINLVRMSSILHGAGKNAAKAFKDLYDVWFDEQGNKTSYLLTFENEGVDLSNATSILNGAGSNAASSFKNLCNLWFNTKGKKVKFLENLKENQINFSSMSSICRGTRTGSSRVFENLYNLWFDKEGKKSQYLGYLEREGINITSVFMMLSGAGLKISDAFKDLFDLWFDENGLKTRYLQSLQNSGISLGIVAAMLRGGGYNTAKSYKDLHDLWFDEEGNHTKYLTFFEKNNVDINTIYRVLRGAGANTAKAFAALHNLWFDKNGNKTKYLKTLDDQGIPLHLIINITIGAGIYAAKVFKNLYDMWFDEEGNKTKYLEILEINEIGLTRMCNILNKANSSAAKAFKNLFDLWFDKENNKTKYLTVLEENDVSFSNIARMLDTSGSSASEAYQNLYDVWFDQYGNKTHYLKCLDINGLQLNTMSSILYRAGTGAAKSYKSLCDLLFDSEGNKTHYAKRFEDNKILLANVSILLGNARNKASNKFLNNYKFWFDEKGQATKLLLKSLGKRRYR